MAYPLWNSMPFLPNTHQKAAMLKDLGISSIETLFLDIPKNLTLQKLDIPKGRTQQQVEAYLRTIAEKNSSFYTFPSFLGGGIKPHYIPPVVSAILSRSEFYSAYTPYQSEASQGFLQAMFEYQSMIAELTGMEIANASLYDKSSAVGEAALMCTRINKKNTFLLAENISSQTKSIVKNYTHGSNITVKQIPYDTQTGEIDCAALEKAITNDTAGVYIESPNYFGVFEQQIKDIERIVHEHNTLLAVGVDPLSLGIVKPPGTIGADIVLGEGRALGNPIDMGGSSLGFFACKKQYLRQIPGRIIGLTTDAKGNRAFCMTLQTREQHIRRGRATSNICTNQGLCAVAACVYLSHLGGSGLQQLSLKNLKQGHTLADKIAQIPSFSKRFTGLHFNEFVINTPDAIKVNKMLLKKGMQGGLPLQNETSDLKNCMLFGITEMHTDDMIHALLHALREV